MYAVCVIYLQHRGDYRQTTHCNRIYSHCTDCFPKSSYTLSILNKTKFQYERWGCSTRKTQNLKILSRRRSKNEPRIDLMLSITEFKFSNARLNNLEERCNTCSKTDMIKCIYFIRWWVYLLYYLHKSDSLLSSTLQVHSHWTTPKIRNTVVYKLWPLY